MAVATLDSAVVDTFKASLRGKLHLSGDDGYDAARRVWNGMIDRRPDLIVRCAGAADVIAAVKFASAHDLIVSVRGGGHNVTGNAVCDKGMMIDLSPMKGIRVDPAHRTVRAEAGLTWGEFDRETQAFGLATTGGQISTTGIAGLTLGGRPPAHRERTGERRSVLGRSWRRWQLRYRHLVRVSSPSGRPTGHER